MRTGRHPSPCFSRNIYDNPIRLVHGPAPAQVCPIVQYLLASGTLEIIPLYRRMPRITFTNKIMLPTLNAPTPATSVASVAASFGTRFVMRMTLIPSLGGPFLVTHQTPE